jgi:hypothetical protein
VAAALVVASVTAAGTAPAHVRLEGQWPDADKQLSLDLSVVPRAQALRKLADAAGWSLVVHAPPGEPVDIHVKGQPASKVLEILLDDGDYVAKRDGTLVSIERDTAAAPRASATAAEAAASAVASASASASSSASSASAPSEAPPAPVAPAPSAFGSKRHHRESSSRESRSHAEDRTVMGGNVHIRKGEAARDVTVFGGSVQVDGEVSGDVTVFGGSVTVNDGAHVAGDATVFGGRLVLANGSGVDGDVNAIGGSVERAPGAQIGGSVSSAGEEGDDDDDDSGKATPNHGPAPDHEATPTLAARVVKHVTHGVRLAAVLYVIGTVLLALGGARMTTLRAEMAARPMRSIALGLVGGLASLLVLIALTVTIIGIPIAIVALLVALFAVLGAMGAVLAVAGEALLRHKTENPYVHLAVGCALFVGVTWIPWVGDIVAAALVLAAIGVLVATRCAGFLPKKNTTDPGAYPVTSA